jgi:hypothetical protein
MGRFEIGLPSGKIRNKIPLVDSFSGQCRVALASAGPERKFFGAEAKECL